LETINYNKVDRVIYWAPIFMTVAIIKLTFAFTIFFYNSEMSYLAYTF